jgi:hypothetical protein
MFNGIPQFADVSGPGTLLQGLQELGADQSGAEIFGQLAKEGSDKQWEVTESLSQWWQLDREGCEAVVEVFAELS